MSENEKMSEDLAAFRLVQHHTMQGEGTWDDFQHRVAALKVLGARLDLCRRLEERVSALEMELEKSRPVSDEVMRDLDELTLDDPED